MTTATLSPALRALIDERLDGIDRVLRHARTPRPERLEILDSVENQILEMLAKRTADEPTRRDLLAVLAELDPPEAYAFGDADRPRDAVEGEFIPPKPAEPKAAAAPAKWSTLAILAGVGVPVWILGAAATYLSVFVVSGDAAALFIYGGFALGVVAAFVNTGLGVWAMVKIHQSQGALKGMLFAAAGACVPLLLLFHIATMYIVVAMIESSAVAVAFFLGIPYLVSLPLPVAWALFERFRRRPRSGD